MPVAGGAVAGNHIYGPGPQDGSKILLSHALPLVTSHVAQRRAVRDREDALARRLRRANAQMMVSVAHGAGAHSRRAAHQGFRGRLLQQDAPQLPVGDADQEHPRHQLQGDHRLSLGNHLNLAMEREEIAGWTISWENLYAVKPEWLREKKVTVFVQYNRRAPARIAGRADARGDIAARQCGRWRSSSRRARRLPARWRSAPACRRSGRRAAQGIRTI